MNRHQRVSQVAALLAIVVSRFLAPPPAAAQPTGAPVDQGTRRQVVERLDRLPLLFVPEQASPDGAMGYAVRGNEASIWLSTSGLAFRLHPASEVEAEAGVGSWVVALDLVGATPRQPVGEDLLSTKVSYFKGPRKEWRTGLPSYGSVVYREPWPGVDLVVSGTAGDLKSTFVVREGADPGLIRLAYRGATAVRLEPDGSLVFDTPLGSITEEAPFAYQEVDGRRVEVAAAFVLEPGSESDNQAYRFRLGPYDLGRELVVDPVILVYCGYIGGADSDNAAAIAVDAAGNAYIAGSTYSTEASFPVAVGPNLTYNGDLDAFVAKINAAGTALDYCGYIGGSGGDSAHDIAIDATGNAYVAGITDSTEASFPVTVGPDLSYNGEDDAFVAKVNPAGTALDYCGYIGGSNYDQGYAIAVDAAGNAYVSGYASSTSSTFPVTVGPDLTHNGGSEDAFAARVNAAGTALDYCGYIGGSDYDHGYAIAVDAVGNAYVVGGTRSTEASFPVTAFPDLTYNGGDYDAFVAKVNAAGTALDYCGYIGGSGFDYARGIAIDADGNSYVTGQTGSTEATFPVTVGPDLSYNGDERDAFVAKVNAAGTALDYCGYIGGSSRDFGNAIAVDAVGDAYVTGYTNSTEATFPVAVGPDLSYNGGVYGDAFVARVNSPGSGLDYCGYIGGSDYDFGVGITVDAVGNAYVAGSTYSTEASFPVAVGPDVTYNGGDRDVFVAKVSSPGLPFADGFESGDTSAWSATVP
jgi:hypothetical protein